MHPSADETPVHQAQACVPDLVSTEEHTVTAEAETRYEVNKVKSTAYDAVCCCTYLYTRCTKTPSRASTTLVTTTIVGGLVGVLVYDVGTTKNIASWIMWFSGCIYVAHELCFHGRTQVTWTANTVRPTLMAVSQLLVILACCFMWLGDSATDLELMSFMPIAFATCALPLGMFGLSMGVLPKALTYQEINEAFESDSDMNV